MTQIIKVQNSTTIKIAYSNNQTKIHQNWLNSYGFTLMYNTLHAEQEYLSSKHTKVFIIFYWNTRTNNVCYLSNYILQTDFLVQLGMFLLYFRVQSVMFYIIFPSKICYGLYYISEYNLLVFVLDFWVQPVMFLLYCIFEYYLLCFYYISEHNLLCFVRFPSITCFFKLYFRV